MNETKKEKMKQYFFVIRELTSREIKRKYARSYLGIVWSVLNPLLTMAVMSLIFSKMFKRNIENYPIYYLTGSVLWSMFTSITNTTMTSLVDNKTMLIKVKLPMIIFPLSRAYTALVNLGYSLVAYVIMLFVFRISWNIYMPLFFLYIVGTFMFATGLGYLLSILYVHFGDIKHLWGVLLSLWMFLSALFYPIENVSLAMQQVIRQNPMYVYIYSARKAILYRQLPNTTEWIQMILWSIGMYFFGWFVFKHFKRGVMQKI